MEEHIVALVFAREGFILYIQLVGHFGFAFQKDLLQQKTLY